MKALLITYHFPPMLGCCALRVGAVARSLAQKGWECHILTAAIPAGHPVYTLDDETQTSEPLWHVYPLSEGFIGRTMQRLRRTGAHPKGSVNVSAKPSVVSRSSRLANFLKAIAFPDSKLGWIPEAYRCAKRLLQKHRFNLIYSFGYPWSCHVVAYALQSGLPWVADYADPWTLNPDDQAFPHWRKRLDFAVESKLLRRTTAVVVATPESKALLGELFGPAISQRSHVARVAQFSSDEYGLFPGDLPAHFQVAFTGLLNLTREPYSFFDALQVFKEQENIRVCLAGLIGDNFVNYASSLGLDCLIHQLGRLGRRQTIGLQQTSHVLLSFGWAGGLQVPCKLYEYFAARRPILHIAGDAQDPAAALVRQYQRGLVVRNDVGAIGEGLCKLYGYWASGTLEQRFDLSPLPEFCLPQSLKGIEEAFAQAISPEQPTGESQLAKRVTVRCQS